MSLQVNYRYMNNNNSNNLEGTLSFDGNELKIMKKVNGKIVFEKLLSKKEVKEMLKPYSYHRPENVNLNHYYDNIISKSEKKNKLSLEELLNMLDQSKSDQDTSEIIQKNNDSWYKVDDDESIYYEEDEGEDSSYNQEHNEDETTYNQEDEYQEDDEDGLTYNQEDEYLEDQYQKDNVNLSRNDEDDDKLNSINLNDTNDQMEVTDVHNVLNDKYEYQQEKIRCQKQLCSSPDNILSSNPYTIIYLPKKKNIDQMPDVNLEIPKKNVEEEVKDSDKSSVDSKNEFEKTIQSLFE